MILLFLIQQFNKPEKYQKREVFNLITNVTYSDSVLNIFVLIVLMTVIKLSSTHSKNELNNPNFYL